jgi:hypothetical protein
MIEEWRDAPGMPGRKVSNLGRVWTPHWNGRILPGHRVYVNGRPAQITVTTKIDGKVRTRSVHRLVLEAFVGPCPPGMEGCHNNGDPWDNCLSNLRWDTHQNNMADAFAHGTFVLPPSPLGNTNGRGEKNVKAKITEAQAREVKSRLTVGERNIDISRSLGISYDTVCKISAGASWAWI